MVKKTGFVLILLFIFLLQSMSIHALAKSDITVTKSVYLTFDDGPNKYTSKILKILKEKKVSATFFMIEPNMKRNPKITNTVIKDGHYPGLHSVSHDKNKLYFGHYTNLGKEMETTRKTLKSITGFNSQLTRVPYGSKPYMKKSQLNYMVKMNFKMWDWNIDTLDWKYNLSNPNQILINIKVGLKGKKGPIVILFHDTKGTAQKLPEIIDYLKSKGYHFKAYDPEQHFEMNFWNDKRL